MLRCAVMEGLGPSVNRVSSNEEPLDVRSDFEVRASQQIHSRDPPRVLEVDLDASNERCNADEEVDRNHQ